MTNFIDYLTFFRWVDGVAFDYSVNSQRLSDLERERERARQHFYALIGLRLLFYSPWIKTQFNERLSQTVYVVCLVLSTNCPYK